MITDVDHSVEAKLIAHNIHKLLEKRLVGDDFQQEVNKLFEGCNLHDFLIHVVNSIQSSKKSTHDYGKLGFIISTQLGELAIDWKHSDGLGVGFYKHGNIIEFLVPHIVSELDSNTGITHTERKRLLYEKVSALTYEEGKTITVIARKL